MGLLQIVGSLLPSLQESHWLTQTAYVTSESMRPRILATWITKDCCYLSNRGELVTSPKVW